MRKRRSEVRKDPRGDGWTHVGRRRIHGGDLIALVAGGLVVLGLVLQVVQLHGRVRSLESSERVAWEHVDALEDQVASNLEEGTSTAKAHQWATVLRSASGPAIPLESAAAPAWGWAVFDEAEGRLLLVLGGLDPTASRYELRTGSRDRMVTRGALDVGKSGRVVVCIGSVGRDERIDIAASADDAGVVLRCTIP